MWPSTLPQGSYNFSFRANIGCFFHEKSLSPSVFVSLSPSPLPPHIPAHSFSSLPLPFSFLSPSPPNFLLPSSAVCFKCSLSFGHWMFLDCRSLALVAAWFEENSIQARSGPPVMIYFNVISAFKSRWKNSCLFYFTFLPCVLFGDRIPCVTQPSWAPTILLSQPPERDSSLNATLPG